MFRLFRGSVVMTIGLTSLLAACGPSMSGPPTPAPATSTSAPAVTSIPNTATPEATAAPAAFPVTSEHKFGATTITAKPERVVAVGLVEQDALLALGVVPVATREWYGARP